MSDDGEGEGGEGHRKGDRRLATKTAKSQKIKGQSEVFAFPGELGGWVRWPHGPAFIPPSPQHQTRRHKAKQHGQNYNGQHELQTPLQRARKAYSEASRGEQAQALCSDLIFVFSILPIIDKQQTKMLFDQL